MLKKNIDLLSPFFPRNRWKQSHNGLDPLIRQFGPYRVSGNSDFPSKMKEKSARPLGARVGPRGSAVPKRSRSRRGHSQKHVNLHFFAQMSAKERKRKSAKERKRAQKNAKERKRALPRKNCKKQKNRFGNSQEEIDVNTNHLSGIIPDAASSLINLWTLSIHSNRLSGKIPDAIGLCIDWAPVREIQHPQPRSPASFTQRSLSRLFLRNRLY